MNEVEADNRTQGQPYRAIWFSLIEARTTSSCGRVMEEKNEYHGAAGHKNALRTPHNHRHKND